MTIYGVGIFWSGWEYICSSSSRDILVSLLIPMTMETFICRIRTHVLMTIFEGLFHSPQTLNGHVKNGTGSLIQHPGATTVKWSQIGAALTFLSNILSLPQAVGKLQKESYTFDTRCKKESETVSDYIVALKKLSIHSGFRDEDQVKKRLRNRLVAGVCSDTIKNRHLSIGARTLTLD